MRIVDFLDRGALLYPELPCLSDGESRHFTYKQTVHLSYRIASALNSAGVGPGSHIAVLSPNDPIGYSCILGLLRAGGVWLPINGRNPVSENIAVLNARRPSWLFFHSDYADFIEKIISEVPYLLGAICIDRPHLNFPHLDTWMDEHRTDFKELPHQPADIAAIVSTGGTTGEPKGAMLPHSVFEAMTATYLACMSMTDRPVHLVVTPMTHGAGVVTFPLLSLGATHIFMKKTEPGAILKAIEKHRVTHLFMPPTLIYMLLAHPSVRQYEYSSLRYFMYAAAPMSVEKLREALDVFGPVMTQTFGQAEAPMICTYLSPQDHLDALSNHPTRLLSCGRPTPLTRVGIMDDAGKIVPSGEMGEIVVQGAIVMSGYHDRPKESAEANAHGWHHTGDIGFIDSDGFVYIVDRKRDMIISGGFNIYPSEIEQVLWSHPGVQDGAVIGVPDDKWGEAVKAIVQLKDGAVTETEELLAFCRDRLGSTKAPKSIEIWPDLPRSAVGKVLKKTIRDRYWSALVRRI